MAAGFEVWPTTCYCMYPSSLPGLCLSCMTAALRLYELLHLVVGFSVSSKNLKLIHSRKGGRGVLTPSPLRGSRLVAVDKGSCFLATSSQDITSTCLTCGLWWLYLCDVVSDEMGCC